MAGKGQVWHLGGPCSELIVFPGWSLMAKFQSLCPGTKKRGFSPATLFRLVAWAALLLPISELVVSAPAQESPKPVAEQWLEMQRVTPMNITSSTVQRCKKKPSKYGVSCIGHRDIGESTSLYSLEKDRQVGSLLARNIEAQSKLITDPTITEYVNHLGQNIVRNSDAQLPFTIKVIESDEINAFALPGGYLYVNSGMIMASDSEAELAGILAHEIAHVVARHAARIQRRRRIWSIAARCSGPAGFALQIAGLLSSMKLNRDAEREADLLGLEYEYATGYDPQASVQFFEKLQAGEDEKHNLIAKALATHPMTEERIRRAQKEISTVLPARSENIIDTSDFEQTKARLAGLTDRRSKAEDQHLVLRRPGP